MGRTALAFLNAVLATAAVVRVAVSQARRLPPVWYRAQVARDLTGDGRPDTLLLEARGTRPDSLHVVFRIRVEGREVYRLAWSNEEEFGDFPLPQEARARADSMARVAKRGLDAFLSPDRFAPLDSSQAKDPWETGDGHACQGDPRDCIAWHLRFEAQIRRRLAAGRDSLPHPGLAYRAFVDSIEAAPFDTARVQAIWTDMRLHTPYTLTMSYGYESTVVIAWSQLAKRFFVLSACC
jgi:hypothetical protein